MQKIAVIFDKDGVLLDTEKPYTKACMDLIRNREGAIGFNNILKGVQTFDELMRLRGTDRYIQAFTNIEEYMDKFGFAQGVNPWFDIKFDTSRLIKPGVVVLLERLLRLQIPMAIVTGDESPGFIRLLGELDLIRYFTIIQTDCDFQRKKPYPDAFLWTMGHLNVLPTQCWVFEDNPRTAPHLVALGTKVVGVRDLKPWTDFEANHCEALVNSLEDVGVYSEIENEQLFYYRK